MWYSRGGLTYPLFFFGVQEMTSVRPSFTEAIERRRRNWRVGLITIIIITIPFYCVGIFLWGTAPQQRTPTPVVTVTTAVPGAPTASPSNTPDGGVIPSITVLPITVFPNTQFPTFGPPPTSTPTRILSPTPTFIIPTQVPPTNPPPPTVPVITDTPLPFE
jgi:hypothetical protein